MNVIGFLISSVLPYVAVGLFLISISVRIYRWGTTPHLLKWSLYPIPQGRPAQLLFMAREVLTFRAVLHNNRKLWAGAWPFHVGMALIALWFVAFVLGLHAGIVLRIGLVLLIAFPVYLFLVRLINSRMRTVSSPLEYFNLLIFIAIGVLGAALAASGQIDSGAVRHYFISLIMFHPVAPPESMLFLSLLALSEFFLIYFPNSRMLHMVSKYFTYDKVSWEGH